MQEKYLLQLLVTQDQIEHTQRLVTHSVNYHNIPDIFGEDPGGKERQYEFRFTGTLGEVVFADVYGVQRPTKSFGAIDGQDFGQDFLIEIDQCQYSFDVKAMRRKNDYFRPDYVLNIPSYQMNREQTVTDYYFCISIHEPQPGQYVASLIGYVKKESVVEGTLGKLFLAGTKRVKGDGNYFYFPRDTYEVTFGELTSPPLPPYLNSPNFNIIKKKMFR